jgi:hypothetical protein
MRFWLEIGFIDHLWIVTSSNSNSLTELHTPDIALTTAHVTSRFLIMDFNSGDSSASVLTPSPAGHHLTANF